MLEEGDFVGGGMKQSGGPCLKCGADTEMSEGRRYAWSDCPECGLSVRKELKGASLAVWTAPELGKWLEGTWREVPRGNLLVMT